MLFDIKRTARIRKQGITKLQWDDWLTVNSIIWYSLLVASLNAVFFSGGSNFMTPEEEAALTPETTAERVAGSKWVLVVEESMVLTVWSCKLGMLFLYSRITYGNPLLHSVGAIDPLLLRYGPLEGRTYHHADSAPLL